MRRAFFAAMMAGLAVSSSGTAHAQAGLLSGRTDLEPITLASGKPLASAPYELTAGKYYRIAIEIRPLGVDSIEFDDEGEATISFVPIRPGSFVLRVPGTSSDAQQAVFNVK